MIYLSIIFTLICLVYHYDYQKHTYGRREWYWGICGLLIILAGLRYHLGIDTVAYEREYQQLPDLIQFFNGYDFSQTRYGIGYLFVCALCRSITDDFVLLQFVEAIFVNITFFGFFKTYTKNIFFAALSYFIISYFNYSYEVLREGFAIAIFLIAWKYFIDSNWWKYYILCSIAILFHPSAMVTLLLPLSQMPIINRIFTFNKFFIFTTIGVFIIFAALSVIFFDLIQLIELSQIQDYADSYSRSKYGQEKDLNIIGFISFAIKSLLYPIAATWLLKRNGSYSSPARRCYFNKLQSSVIFNIYLSIGSLFIMILYRFAGYFSPFVIILISDTIFSRIKVLNKKIRLSFSIWMILILPFIAIYMYSYLSQDGESGVRNLYRYYPYESVLDPVKNPNREKLYRFYDR